MKIRCLNCGKEPAIKRDPWGYLPGLNCQKRAKRFYIKETIEQTTDGIREDRKEYETDILQRYRGDTANKRYIKKYGTKGFTPEEVKNAKDVFPNFYRDED